MNKQQKEELFHSHQQPLERQIFLFLDVKIKKELIDIINIQLKDNQKARILDTDLNNNYVPSLRMKKVKSQVETHHYLIGKK